MKHRTILRTLAIASAGALALAGCASKERLDPTKWDDRDLVGYRLLSKADFQAETSAKVWGNIYHGAEICTLIVPSADIEPSGAFRAVMNPKCSFWNKTGSVGTLGGLAGVSVIPGLPTRQPDWYILQHEQIHFAIEEVAALRLSNEIAALPAARRAETAIAEAYRATVSRTDARQAEFDADTSGRFDPVRLGAWVRALEKEMRALCGWEERCWVRHQTPMGWGD